MGEGRPAMSLSSGERVLWPEASSCLPTLVCHWPANVGQCRPREQSTVRAVWTLISNSSYNLGMETQHVSAIFEGGKLLPLVPLDLEEHERVELTVVRAAAASEQSEDDYVPLIVAEADPTVTLEQVQRALSRIPGSLVEDFARERDERF